MKLQRGSFQERLKKLSYPVTPEKFSLQYTRLGKDYLIFDLIAAGSQSTIYYGINQPTGQQCAFKFYNLKQLEQLRSFRQKEVCKRLSNYVYEIMYENNENDMSINVLRYLDVFEDRNYKVIIMEYCGMGSLKDQIKRRSQKMIDETRAINILAQIISGLKALHRRQHLHKNLKSEHILIKNGVYKIANLGLPKIMDLHQNEEKFIIPEIIQKSGYDSRAEVWSLGVLFHQILFGVRPEGVSSRDDLLRRMSKPSLFDSNHYSCSPVVADFLTKCLMIRNELRMDWQTMLSHNMFTQIEKSKEQKEKEQISKSRIRMSLSTQQGQRLSTLLFVKEEQEKADLEFYKKKFHLAKQIIEIEKQLEKPYIKKGKYFEIEHLQESDWQNLKKKTNLDEQNNYLKMKEFYLECLKSEFIYYDILSVLRSSELLEPTRESIEFYYLLIFRCFTNMSNANWQSGKIDTYNNLFIDCILNAIAKLYQKVLLEFENISKALTEHENRLMNRFKDRVLSWTKGYDKKNKLMTGIQKEDFTKEQQIIFTYEAYKLNIQERLEQNIAKIDKPISKQVEWAIKYLKKYVQICSLKGDQIQKYPTFKAMVHLQVLD